MDELNIRNAELSALDISYADMSTRFDVVGGNPKLVVGATWKEYDKVVCNLPILRGDELARYIDRDVEPSEMGIYHKLLLDVVPPYFTEEHVFPRLSRRYHSYESLLSAEIRRRLEIVRA